MIDRLSAQFCQFHLISVELSPLWDCVAQVVSVRLCSASYWVVISCAKTLAASTLVQSNGIQVEPRVITIEPQV
jgi:hypothetical protein